MRWAALAAVFVAIAAGQVLRDERADQEAVRRFLPVTGVVAQDYRGGAIVPVTYHNPVTDQQVETDAYAADGDAAVAGQSVDFLVDPTDPDDARFPGYQYDYRQDALLLLVVPFAFLALWLLRRRRISRLVKLMGGSSPTFAMLAALAPASKWRSRAELHLYALDAPTGARPVCSVTLLDTGEIPCGTGVFPVLVKGVPRPMGWVVAWAGDAVLWPVGRASMTASAPRPPAQAPALGPLPLAERPWCRWRPDWRLLRVEYGLLAAALLAPAVVAAVTAVNGSAARAVQQHGVRVIAEVTRAHWDDSSVTVSFRLPNDTAPRFATAPVDYPDEYTEGRRYPARVDPDNPSKVRMAREPYDAVEPVAWAALGTPCAVALLVARRRAVREAKRVATDGQWRHAHAYVVWGKVGRLLAVGPAPGLASVVVPAPDDDTWRLTGPGSMEVAVAGRLVPGEAVALAIAGQASVPAQWCRAPRADELLDA